MNQENMKAMATIAIDRYNNTQRGPDRDRILTDRRQMTVVDENTVVMETRREKVVISKGRFDSQFKVIAREYYQ